MSKIKLRKKSLNPIRYVSVNGMSKYNVMIFAEHSSFATTQDFYLAVASDLVHRAREATAKGLRQKLVHFGADVKLSQKGVDSTYRNSLYCNDLNLEHP